MDKLIQLSPSKLSIFKKCVRCFWLQEKYKVVQPRGIFPSLPGGIDRKLKTYFDGYRGSLPPQLEGKVPGALFHNQDVLNKWRNWKSGLVYENKEIGVKLIGALDDCLVNHDLYSPLDYKTKGSEPKDDGSQYYQTQLDCYCLMLNSNGYKISEKAYLVYVYPGEVFLNHPPDFIIPFETKIYEINCSGERALRILTQAVKILSGPIPEADESCEQCRFVTEYNNVAERIRQE